MLDDHEPYASLWGNAAFPLIFADGFEVAGEASTRALADARRRGSPIGAARGFAVSAILHLRQGRVRAAERFLENWVLHARGRLRLAQGRVDAAIADLEEMGRRGEHGWRPWNPDRFCYRSDLASAYIRIGSGKRALELAVEEVTLARRLGAPRAIGIALRVAGLAAGRADLELLRESVGVLAGSGAALEHARSLVELGAAIRRSGQRTEAREPLRAGMDMATHCGATALATRPREELVAAGARPRRAALSGTDSLTPSELRVARLAREGLTNREIAQTLFVTLRTVQVHLTNTYRKLDIDSRAQLPEHLLRPAGDTSGVG